MMNMTNDIFLREEIVNARYQVIKFAATVRKRLM